MGAGNIPYVYEKEPLSVWTCQRLFGQFQTGNIPPEDFFQF